MEDELDLQRERFSAVLLQGVSAGTITLDEYDFKLGAIYAAQSVAELESLVPWALVPQRKRSRVALFSICGGVAAALVAITVVASIALSGPTRAHPARVTSSPSLAPVMDGQTSVTAPSTSVTAGPTLVPNVTTLSTVAAAAPDIYGPPNGSTAAVVSVDEATRHVTLMGQQGDISYSVCAGFGVVTRGGGEMGLSGLQTGAFGTVAVDSGVPCLKSVQVLPTAGVPECTSSSGLPGDGDVRWEGFNPQAHSVLYRGVSYGPLNATRWCGAPVVVGPDKAAIKMSQIPIGSVVNMYLNGNDWVTGINYCGRQQCYG
jgi:hypothetical protein